MKLAIACPYYGPTPPIVGDGVRANLINAVEAGHQWIDDYSVSGTQHRNACEAMAFKAGHDKRIDAVFWHEHDVLLPPLAVTQLCETLEKTPEADMVTGITFKRGEPYNPMVAKLCSLDGPDALTRERYEEMKTSADYHVRRAAKLMSFEEMRTKVLMSIHVLDTQAPAFPADTASMCAVLFRREVFEKTLEVPDLFAIDPMGFFSIDNMFFLRLKELGFKLYCDPRVLCGHIDQQIVDATTWMKFTHQSMRKVDLKQQERLRAEDRTGRIHGELNRLAFKHGTDKGDTDHSPDSGWTGWIHNYCDFYQAMLEPIRLSARRVMEIGVWHGASLKMWRDYFPEATVYGVDNWSQVPEAEKPKDLGDRIVVREANQANRVDLERVAAEDGPFDLIVDDGSHVMEHQQVSLGCLFPHVRPGGYYILEDLHTSFLTGHPDFGLESDGSNSTAKMIEALSDGKPAESKYMTSEELAYLNANVESCWMYGKKSITSVIRKRA